MFPIIVLWVISFDQPMSKWIKFWYALCLSGSFFYSIKFPTKNKFPTNKKMFPYFFLNMSRKIFKIDHLEIKQERLKTYIAT